MKKKTKLSSIDKEGTAQKNILIIGDACLDVFVYCSCKRLCPEGPVPVLDIVEVKRSYGMAGNVLRNVKALGAKAKLICNSNFKKITKTRYVDKESNHLFIRIDKSLPTAGFKNIKNIDFSDYSCVIVSDYEKGFLSHNDLIYISENHPLTFIDTKKKLGDWAKSFSFIKINEKELEASIDCLTDSIKGKVITTLGPKGCVYKGQRYEVEKAEVKDLSGAGDTFLSSFAVKYLSTGNEEESIKFANKCSSLVVSKRGVATI